MAISGGTSGDYSIQWHGPEYGTANIYCAPSNDTPRMFAQISYNITRSNERDKYINIHVNGFLYQIADNSRVDPFTGNYGGAAPSTWCHFYGPYINLYATVNGNDYLIAHKDAGSRYTYNAQWRSPIQQTANGYDLRIEWTNNDATVPIGIKVDAGCYVAAFDWCPSGNYSTTLINAKAPNYVSRIDPTPQTDGAIFSTNNTGGIHRGQISDKPDTQVWWDWWGQSEGTVGFNGSNIDISKTNDSSGASSIAITQNYTQNTKVSLWDIARAYNARIGDTLYCWVNTETTEGVWLGRQYLGAIKLRKDGKIQYKDSNGTVHEITKVYYKDSNGATKKARYARIKDSGGATRVIDVYTTLYK